MKGIRKEIFCLLTIAGLSICIGMSNGAGPINERKQTVIMKEMQQKPETAEKENKVLEQEKEVIKPLNVPLILQKPELMRGCEVTSLAMILQFSGVQVEKLELASKIKYVPFESNGRKGNMHKGFIGDIATFNKPGLGVYIEPILELAKLYVPDEKVVDLSHKEPEHIYKMIDQGNPVWVITNALFKQFPDNQFYTWKTDVGEMKVTYQQHSVVVTDYDEQYVYINDPLKKYKHRAINRNNFEQSWIQMGRQAMTISI
ncbi:C39 family peptidase [Bacillus thuringiensis]|uniref:C39 family peptidase n=1 Tax=Bacillus thuringiensis TaxID=1428 RepID=UPI00119E2B75|nr:C39 family peptidase [Bacillus thuringiensis]